MGFALPIGKSQEERTRKKKALLRNARRNVEEREIGEKKGFEQKTPFFFCAAVSFRFFFFFSFSLFSQRFGTKKREGRLPPTCRSRDVVTMLGRFLLI